MAWNWHWIGKDWGYLCQCCANPLRGLAVGWCRLWCQIGPIHPPSRPTSNPYRSLFNRLEAHLSSECPGLAWLLPMRVNAWPILCQFDCSWQLPDWIAELWNHPPRRPGTIPYRALVPRLSRQMSSVMAWDWHWIGQDWHGWQRIGSSDDSMQINNMKVCLKFILRVD